MIRRTETNEVQFVGISEGHFQYNVIRKLGDYMDNIVFREAGIDDAEKMISYLNIVGRESDNLMHGSNGFNVPIEAVKQRIQAYHDADNSVIMIALAG